MKPELKSLLVLMVGSVLIMLLGPFTVHEHYIYGLLAILLVMLVYLPYKIVLPIVFLATLFWVNRLEFKTASIQTTDRIACVSAICQQFSQPVYVVTNSGSHDHQGLGYAYLAQQMGCNMYAVTQWTDQEPKTMAVMNENTSFDFSGTDFYEINRFGDREFVRQVDCGINLSASIFSH
jgi:hypothetical protein